MTLPNMVTSFTVVSSRKIFLQMKTNLWTYHLGQAAGNSCCMEYSDTLWNFGSLSNVNRSS